MTSCQNCFTVPAITGPLHITGSVVFSRSRFTDIVCMPVLLVTGKIPLSSPIARSVMPKALGIDGPVISASSTAVWNPFFWKLTASMEDTIDFPTPPLPLIIPITFLILLSL